MAFFLAPRFAPAYQHCGPFNCAPARQHHYSKASNSSFPSFLGQLDGLFSELEREARRESPHQRQQRKRTFRARFDVKETKNSYEVEGDIPGFEQENISIEVTDEHTLKISGDTEQKTESEVTEPEAEKMDDVTPTEPDNSDAASQTGSETGSHKSYQPTVEDDFEDLGADSTPATPSEPKGKEKAVEKSMNTEKAIQKQPQSEVPIKQQEPETKQWLSERVRGSFERTFEFPERIDMAGVKASLRNGVLSVSIPKAPAFQTKRIRIQ